MRVAIVENTRYTHHGQIGVALHEAGAMVDIYRPFADGKLPAWDSFNALVVLGGEQNARADDTHPYLPDLARLMMQTALGGKATLGVCLGSQILARGAGAENLLGSTPEFGWVKVDLTPAGQADPVLGSLPQRFDTFQWHSDTFRLPEGAVKLAANTSALQAYRIGRAGYATQFHFEASRQVVAQWTESFADFMERQNPGFLANRPALARDFGAQADENGLSIARAWVSLI